MYEAARFDGAHGRRSAHGCGSGSVIVMWFARKQKSHASGRRLGTLLNYLPRSVALSSSS